MKIAIVVHGRFYAFDLATALLKRGHEVGVYTNYPAWAAARFGVPRDCVRSCWPHGLMARALDGGLGGRRFDATDAILHRAFGRWAASEVSKEPWDVIHAFSGIAEELFRLPLPPATLKTLVRGSAHIRTQARLLREEAARTGVAQEVPTLWIVAREEREYQLADRILVLSRFAYDTFVEEGIPPSRVCVLPLGASLDTFRPSPAIVEERRARIRSGAPLRVLAVGNFSFQKGAADLASVVQALDGERFSFRFVGTVLPETRHLARAVRRQLTFVPRVPQHELPTQYAWADLFLFPTIQDGFAVVLAQAKASGLPILTTPNCTGPDLVEEGITGWVLPIRDPAALVDRLEWCDQHREHLSAMVESIYERFQPWAWSDVAARFEAIVREASQQGVYSGAAAQS